MSQSQEKFWTERKKDRRTKGWAANSYGRSGHGWGWNNNNNNNNKQKAYLYLNSLKYNFEVI